MPILEADWNSDRNCETPISRLLIVADRRGATPHISFIQPLRELVERNQMSVRLERYNRHWSSEHFDDLISSFNPELIVLSRCVQSPLSLFIDKARARGIPVIFHLDDDLLDVPATLSPQQYEFYKEPSRLNALYDGLNRSDLIYVSTRALGQRLNEHGIKGPMIHGEIYCSVDPDAFPPIYPATFPVIGYMGSAGHGHDLGLIASVIERMLEAIPALSFETFGTINPLPQLARFGSRVIHHPPVADYGTFLEKLNYLGWWVGLAPLEDNAFNRCKADTKWVEYSYAGMAVVAQNVPVYARACSGGAGVLAGSETEWMNSLWKLIRTPSDRESLLRNARAKLKSTYSHEALRRQVLSVLAKARTGDGVAATSYQN